MSLKDEGSTALPNGGPAFPGIGHGPFVGSFIPMHGLTKREWYAGMALQGILFRLDVPNLKDTLDNSVRAVIKTAFIFADAMLVHEENEKK